MPRADPRQLRAIGQAIVDLLDLKKNSDGRYDTTWGTKTTLGLGSCVQRIMEEANEHDHMGVV